MDEMIQQPQEGPAENSCPSPEELAGINAYTRREFKAEELYVFSVVLCDNEIDRDLERFSIPALEKMAGLFCGKTGIYNHSMDANTQSARIFRCETEQVPGRSTECGEPYTRLVARAYLPRGGKNESLILDLESGMKKEVSVGCSMGHAVCSICGADRRTEPCGHVPGERYGGTRCCTVLEDPLDAYEWSFVAVPAQREAGDIKRYEEHLEQGGDHARKVWKTQQEAVPGGLQGQPPEGWPPVLLERVKGLEQAAGWGRIWRQELAARVKKMGRLALPELEASVLESLVESAGVGELRALEKAFTRRAEKDFPLFPQLAVPEAAACREQEQNRTYQI